MAGPQQPSFRLLPRVANVPPWILKPKYPRIRKSTIKSYKFVDDSINTNSVNMRSAVLLTDETGPFKEVIDKRTEKLLAHVASNAELKGMRIDVAKTSLMCISAASSFSPRVKVSVQGEEIKGMSKLKILGVTLDQDCTFGSHIESLRNKIRKRTWALAKLRRRGLGEDKLVRAYSTLIRPVVEYASPAWGNSITAEQAERLEKQQTQALKNIYGTGKSAAKMRDLSGVPTLNSRR